MKSHPILSIAYPKLFTMKLNPLRICSVDCILPLWQSLYSSLFAFPAGDYSTFHGMKWLRVSLLPLGWDVSPSEGTPPFPPIILSGFTVRGKCFAQEHNNDLARSWTQTPQLESSTLSIRPLYLPQVFMPGYLSFLEDLTLLKVFAVDFVCRRKRWTKRKIAISRFLIYKTI